MPMPAPAPPMTRAAGMTVTPFFWNGSPYTRRTPMTSRFFQDVGECGHVGPPVVRGGWSRSPGVAATRHGPGELIGATADTATSAAGCHDHRSAEHDQRDRPEERQSTSNHTLASATMPNPTRAMPAITPPCPRVTMTGAARTADRHVARVSISGITIAAIEIDDEHREDAGDHAEDDRQQADCRRIGAVGLREATADTREHAVRARTEESPRTRAVGVPGYAGGGVTPGEAVMVVPPDDVRSHRWPHDRGAGPRLGARAMRRHMAGRAAHGSTRGPDRAARRKLRPGPGVSPGRWPSGSR